MRTHLREHAASIEKRENLVLQEAERLGRRMPVGYLLEKLRAAAARAEMAGAVAGNGTSGSARGMGLINGKAVPERIKRSLEV